MSLFTVKVAARQLGIGYSTLKQWIYSGKVRTTTTPGGHHRISEAEIDRLIAHTPDATPLVRADTPSGILVALSPRNKLRGFVDEVRVDGLLAQVRVRIGTQTLTAVVTADAVAELKIKRGDDIVAIIKSTEVMLGREAAAPATATRGKAAGRPRKSGSTAPPTSGRG